MSYYFAIIGTKDNPLFEYEFGTSRQGGDGVARFRDEARHMNQFVVHSSLDIAEEVMWGSGAMYQKTIDRFYNTYISLFLTGSGAKFLLLHNPDPSATHNAFIHPLQPPAARPSSSTSKNRPSTPQSASRTTAGVAPFTASSSSASPSRSSTYGIPGERELKKGPISGLDTSSNSTLVGSGTGPSAPPSSSGTLGQAPRGAGYSTNSIAGNPTSAATEEAVRNFFADVFEAWCKTVMNPFYTVDGVVRSPVFRGRVAQAGRKWL